ncbi:hypothetical protein ASPWEDRAFT_188248 [Aspergillus wentii DTO 134E9]|uniref:DAPG hydrolase PhiG domain-containing protein n=1 Tax=Aspergillus wentii DTO 134E9 TaxID=1073089 RepID=A0A1L9R4L5_ASPWE|nr:uncharacterized protein ASPWEDRAFT_188248 [Aspergillus wentii DTO 134E9]KAI9927101.1 hypothetical protein MW887_003484 [Aspergillus wentii]OJJ29823.1 hypothetical protein ASPWEDRAFT_188248 [Aspergillus wentii DTO 134E9]
MAPRIPSMEDYDPTSSSQALLLRDAPFLLKHDYLPLEAGYAVAPDGMHHIAGSTYMRDCTGAMINWWFGWIHNTEQYKLWHPRDHVFSDWEGARNNDSTYIGGHHLVHEYIGTEIAKLKISFLSPSNYFGPDWEDLFKEAGYSTAICGRVGSWNDDNSATYYGHLIHLIKDEPDGCRMRSRFWLGDAEGVTEAEERVKLVPDGMSTALLKHCTEEMAILATRLPAMYKDFS